MLVNKWNMIEGRITLFIKGRRRGQVWQQLELITELISLPENKEQELWIQAICFIH